MADLTRHVGRLNNTGTKVVVVFRKVPGDEENCLIVESDHLPDMYHDNLMTILNSREAQAVVDLYDVLHRSSFGDGGNCLQTLHETGRIKKVPIALVEMMPYPNYPVPLTMINEQIDGPAEQTDTAEQVSVEEVKGKSYQEQTPPAAAQVQPAAEADPNAQAESLLTRAGIMEQTAEQLKEEAYMLNPTLRPGRGRPKLTADAAEAKKEERNQKRRERYAAQKAKESKATS